MPATLLAVALAATACGGSPSGTDAGTTATTAAAPSSGAAGEPSAVPAPSSSAPGSSAAPADTADVACARTALARLGPEQRAAQLVMVGVPATDPASGASLVAQGVGGVFLQGRSTASTGSVAAQVEQLQAAARTPLLVSADVEGGEVQTLSGPGIGEIPSALAQGADDPATLAASSAAWATGLRQAGVTLDLAPVADVVPAGTGAANPPIGAFDRQYGATPGAVSAAVGTVVTAAQGAGLLTTAKHFPGLGRVTVNTDTSTGATDAGDVRTDGTLDPFRAAITAGAAAVMVSSASYPQLDAQNLAVFSPAVITDLLRGELGFGGLVLTDDVGAAVAVADVPPAQRATRFLEAGGDVVLTVQPSDVAPMVAALAAPELADRVAGSALRVLTTKARARLLPGC